MYELILVSESPRRRQLLWDAGFEFRTDTVKISEIIEENVNIPDAILQIARQKLDTFRGLNNQLKSLNILALTADTMVVIDNKALGKPKTSAQATDYLRLLSGRQHEVMTAFCLYNFATSELVCNMCTTKVLFRQLSDLDIKEYVASGEPMDKAGAYAIQGLGKKFVVGITGSYSNVVGLPIEEIIKIFYEKKWNVKQRTNS